MIQPMVDMAAIVRQIRWAESDRQAAAKTLEHWDQDTYGTIPLAAIPDEFRSQIKDVGRGREVPREVIEQLQDGSGSVCGASYCMAGERVVTDDHFRLIYRRSEESNRITADLCVEQRVLTTDLRGLPIFEDVPGTVEEIHAVAARLFGLDEEEAEEFFRPGLDIDDLKSIANWIAQRHGLGSPYPFNGTYDPDA